MISKIHSEDLARMPAAAADRARPPGRRRPDSADLTVGERVAQQRIAVEEQLGARITAPRQPRAALVDSPRCPAAAQTKAGPAVTAADPLAPVHTASLSLSSTPARSHR